MKTLPTQFSNPARAPKFRVSSPPRSRSNTMKIEIVQGGRVLRQHTYEGRSYIEAPPEGEYIIRVSNTSSQRKLAVISVDGLNIVNGEKAGYDGPGYVILPWQSVDIKGWRRNDDEVASFQFKPQESSYSAQTGQGTSNTGVIGVAIFDEKIKYARPGRFTGLGSTTTTTTTTTTTRTTSSVNERINARARAKGLNPDGSARKNEKIHDGTMYSARLDYEESDSWDDDGALPAGGGAASWSAGDMPVAGAASAASEDSEPVSARLRSRSSSPMRRLRREKSPELGTGYGKRTAMYTQTTTFDRVEMPSEVITLQYAVRAKLIEWGVPLPSVPPQPEAFPASAGPSVAAPPGWRG